MKTMKGLGGPETDETKEGRRRHETEVDACFGHEPQTKPNVAQALCHHSSKLVDG